MDSIPLKECKHRFLYRIHSRNLDFGIFNKENNGFVGLRYKSGDLFLFTELHDDLGHPHGTVRPLEELEVLPEEIALKTRIESIDAITKRLVAFDKPKSHGGRGWYFLDTGESSEDIDPVARQNKELFNWLKEKEEQYQDKIED